ncbi:MAG: helix-turn-helix transcriptional regulator [Eubacteriales bacterium]|nr:helix-turn-helix transcriptional regulator [Eubacteriales bacterium]MDD3882199.1 helix-turn-helix transcriptional regulator [Eubacteriales bacterium]MDD4512548.1 helix-turn-helix transcriptional regulator [Eubacteriales bacterium]
MSRLGDLLQTERLRHKMTAKQVAKKAGVSEKYLIEVESGKRIIADDQARRILKLIGLTEQTESNFSLDDIAATVDLSAASPLIEQEVKKLPKEKLKPVASAGDGAESGIWLDALAGVLKRVPVYNAVMKEVEHKVLPVLNGKIENAAAEKVFYFLSPDDSMRGFRIYSGDLALIVPAQSPIEDAIMLVEANERRALRKVRKQDATHVLLQSFGREYNAEVLPIPDVKFLGRAVRLEIELG